MVMILIIRSIPNLKLNRFNFLHFQQTVATFWGTHLTSKVNEINTWKWHIQTQCDYITIHITALYAINSLNI